MVGLRLCCIGRRGRRRLEVCKMVSFAGRDSMVGYGGEGRDAHFSYNFIAGCFFPVFYLAFVLVFLKACISLSDYSLDLRVALSLAIGKNLT
jgi:hypothetical protein